MNPSPDAFGGEGLDKFFADALPAVGGVDRQFAGVAVGCCQGNQLAVDTHRVMGMAEAGFCQPPEELLRERLDAIDGFYLLEHDQCLFPKVTVIIEVCGVDGFVHGPSVATHFPVLQVLAVKI